MPIFVGAGTSSFLIEDGVGLPNLTTTERNALSGSNLNEGQIIYNSTTSKIEFYDGSNWASVSTPFQAAGGNAADGAISGGYKYHTFTNSGTFTVTAGTTDAEILVVGGGGGGG